MITTAVSFIVVLGVLITVHELGHFLVAKALRIGVERFSIGFPPRMFGFTPGETEYCVSWIPLGGYVKLKGEGPEEVVDDPDDPALFSSRPPYQRAAVIMAGPVMNLLFAFAVMPLHFMVGTQIPAYFEDPPVAGWVEPGSPADGAGIVPGDLILSVNGETAATWEQFGQYLEKASMGRDGSLRLEIRGHTGMRTAELDREQISEDGIGIGPRIPPVIGKVTPGYPAQKAGIMEGDRVLSLGNVPVAHFNEMARILRASAGKNLTMVVMRGGEEITLSVSPVLDEKKGIGLIGITSGIETVVRRWAPADAMRKGFEKNIELLGVTFSFLRDLVTGRSSIKNMGGPVMIFQVSGQAARAGLDQFLWFLAFLSLQLGVLNLFPIPILDGGHLLFLTAEGILRRPLEVRTMEMAQRVGFFLLITLIIVITYNDILRLFGVG